MTRTDEMMQALQNILHYRTQCSDCQYIHWTLIGLDSLDYPVIEIKDLGGGPSTDPIETRRRTRLCAIDYFGRWIEPHGEVVEKDMTEEVPEQFHPMIRVLQTRYPEITG